jgi:tetratricopeptide (TPR) repeat protein
MKKHLILIGLILLASTLVFSQSKSKSKQKETPPTQKELAEMMKEMQMEVDNLDPESKRMMDSMGIKMPSSDMLPQMTDAQLQEAYDNDSRIVPKRDDVRITSISKTALTNTALPAFMSSTHRSVVAKLKPASNKKGEEVYKAIKAQYNSPVATGNAAVGLWMIGKTELALYVEGKACQDDPRNTDNLNNYAAMMSMSGGEQLSIPLLKYLNQRFPKNSTILNNIGQAWFGLGDVDKANSYLDSAVRLCANHPQANYTKSFIEESKDHQAAALDAAKRSIKKSYSPEKERRVSELGDKVKSDDISWNSRMPQDPLGLEKFHWPEYPKNVEQSRKMEKEWSAFKLACETEMNALQSQQEGLEKVMNSAGQIRTQQLLQAGKQGRWFDAVPPLAPKAIIKLKYLVDGKDGQLQFSYQKKVEAMANAAGDEAKLEKKLEKQLEEVHKKYDDQFGEGKLNPFAAACSDENSVINSFLSASNMPVQQASTDYLGFLRKMINDEIYYYQYTMWPEDFEVAKVNAKLRWLNSIHGQYPAFHNSSSFCQAADSAKSASTKLAAFDDVHCMYHSELTTPVGTIKTDCSRVTTQLDLKFLKLGLKQDMDKETFGDQFMSCSVEVGAGVSVGSKAGPIKAEASVSGALGLEFDRTGLKDVIVKGSAGVSAGSDIIKDGSMAGSGVSDVSLEVGMQGQVSIISGISSVGGTGLLAGPR